jgi:hypothetical protein
MREIRTSGSMRGEWGALLGAVFPSPLLYSVANLGQPQVPLVIVRSAHNYSLKWKVHAVNFKTNEVRQRFATSPSGLLAMTKHVYTKEKRVVEKDF